MSGFDVMMRSQQQASQSNQFYDAQRYESMRQTGGAIQQLGQFSVELGMQQTEQAMRIQQHEQQFQINALKLQAMQALDQTALSREAVRGAKLQNDVMQQEYDQKAEMHSYGKKYSAEQSRSRILSALGGAEGALTFGLDENLQEMDPKKLEEALERAKSLRRGSGTAGFNQERNYYQMMHRMAEDAFDQEGMDYWKSRAEALDPAGAVNSQGYRAQPRPVVKAEDKKAITEIASKIKSTKQPEFKNPMSGAGDQQKAMLGITTPVDIGEHKEKVAQVLYSRRNLLQQAMQVGYQKDPERLGLVSTPEGAVDRAIAILNDPFNPERERLISILKRLGAFE